MLRTFLFLLFTLLAAPAFAHNYIKIGHVWATPTANKEMGAVYIPLWNTGKEPDALVSIETPAAEKAEVHRIIMDNNIARMRPMEKVELPPGEKVVMAPGGIHVMLIGMKEPLKNGGRIPLTLHFAKAGDITVEVHVQAKTATDNELGHEHHQ